MPSPISYNPNRIFLQGGRWGNFPVPEFNGIKTYTIGVWYLFGILSPEGLTSDFMLGNLPFPGLDTNEYIPGSYYNYQLINGAVTQIIGGKIPIDQPFLSGIVSKG